MRKSTINLLFITMFTITGPVIAESYKYKIDPVHTQVLFTVSHLGFSNSSGAFVGPEGHFEFDENNVENSSVEVTIHTTKLDMDNATWKMHLSSVNFFNVDKFPTMTFKSTKVVKTGENTMDVIGDFTLLGTTKSITLKVKHNKTGEMMGKTIAGFSATTTIDRTEYDMDEAAPFVGAQVNIRLEVEGIRI